MDTLTHGLFGLAIGALRPRDAPSGPLSATDKAVLFACVLAAELPDLDYLLPAPDPVLVTLRAHRGLSHALAMAPLVAMVAALAAKLLFRGARLGPVAAQALAAVVFGHLLPDAWTGWGTRVLLPFSAERVTLDWTMVVDPIVTLPLLVGAVIAYRRRRLDFRRPLAAALALVGLYVGARVALRAGLESKVEAAYGPGAAHVFPAPLRVLAWRYVAEVDGGYAAGDVDLFSAPRERARHEGGTTPADPFRGDPIVDEVLAWARYPTATVAEREGGGRTLTVADLRYHAAGEPTLKFVVDLSPEGRAESARLDRGGGARELVDRFRR